MFKAFTARIAFHRRHGWPVEFEAFSVKAVAPATFIGRQSGSIATLKMPAFIAVCIQYLTINGLLPLPGLFADAVTMVGLLIPVGDGFDRIHRQQFKAAISAKVHTNLILQDSEGLMFSSLFSDSLHCVGAM